MSKFGVVNSHLRMCWLVLEVDVIVLVMGIARVILRLGEILLDDDVARLAGALSLAVGGSLPRLLGSSHVAERASVLFRS